MELNKWIEKNDTVKGYAHFDKRTSIKKVWHEINNPENIISHGFLPFIHLPLVFHKYSKKTGRKDKVRQLYYSSHYDRCIYQYYSYLLNEKYNQLVLDKGIDQNVIAYRTNCHKNNIHFAKEAFDFIKKQDQCFIIVGDFKNFFDTLDHLYLKKQICRVLNQNTLPEDFYKVYRSITKYSFVDFSDIIKFYNKSNIPSTRRELNRKEVLLPIQTLRKNCKLIQKNSNNYGIPQGSAISAILSNVYMIEFDQNISAYIKEYNGKYLRYSDDTIFILPVTSESTLLQIFSDIKNRIGQIPNLTLQDEKTKLYLYTKKNLENKDSLINQETNSKNVIDYLGFSFDGKNIYLRDKTISKYYYRAYKKADNIADHHGISPKGNIISNKNLYQTYTLKGATSNSTSKGNFISYVLRCKQIFGENEKVVHILNTHYRKLKQRIHK